MNKFFVKKNSGDNKGFVIVDAIDCKITEKGHLCFYNDKLTPQEQFHDDEWDELIKFKP